MKFIDTHCHLDGEEFNDDRDAVVQRAREAGCTRIFLPAIDLKTCHTVLDVCAQYPGYCFPMLGLHPEEVRADWREQLAAIHTLLQLPLPSERAGGEASVYAIGDARRGPATVVEGIADAMVAAEDICREDRGAFRSPPESPSADESLYLYKKGQVAKDSAELPDWRCLGCPAVCEVCADVCPNRANVVIHVPGKCQAQIIHVDGMCNECGNCAVFCPYTGRPYRVKFTLFWTEEDFADSSNEGFLMVGEDSVKIRLDGQEQTVKIDELDKVSADAAAVIRTVIQEYGYLI